MELNHIRAIIFYNFRRGLTYRQCIDELNSNFGDEAPSRTSVYRWYCEFNRGHSSLQDEFHEGRPKSVVPETIGAVSQLILQDHYVTYCEIETTLGISGTSIYSILHEHLTVKKKFFRVGSHTICQSCRWVERNAPKIRSRCFQTRL